MINNKCLNCRRNDILVIMMICSNKIYDVKNDCSNGQSYFKKCVDCSITYTTENMIPHNIPNSAYYEEPAYWYCIRCFNKRFS